MREILSSPSARRRFLARLGAGAGLAGAATFGAFPAAAQVAAGADWHPARHAEDDWLDVPALHRFVFDTTTPDGVDLALRFANNYFVASQNAYGLQGSDLAVLIILRHKATSFGYTDAMWLKYGAHFSAQSGFIDPKTNQPPAVNVYATGSDSRMGAMAKRGVHFAVCQFATRAIILNFIKASGSDADKIQNELAANLIPNARPVPAGIVTVNRAQERGYSFAHAI